MNSDLVRQSIENLKLTHPDLLGDNDAWLSTLGSETSFEELLTSVLRQIEDAKALSIGTKARLEELADRKVRFERRVEMLRDLLFKMMQTAELAKIELPEASLSLRAGQRQLIGDNDAGALSPQFQKVTVTPDRKAIKDALETGQTVPGFSLSNATPSLTIRIK